ncbi:TIGR04282 family arsenosugar biosynthesis glycosyltransferase [Maribacter sp. 2210JD10-5]|uniref:TIGR04282 family arsenosugar biosynthesis glycosyltransferase n=1 Tax=Maribacter sp. 2210JD10-5 TaxID=3386272 RepID=UPI0039BCC988
MLHTKKETKDDKTIDFHLANSKNLLLIFTRNPELGKCKTRLAAKVGNLAALDIYKFLLDHTVKITQNLFAKKIVYYSEEIWENDIWNNTFFEKRQQKGTDLGKRMENAFIDGFERGFEKIIIIGSDMFDLDQNDLEKAFSALNQNDFVMGPAQDGGYYLLGMKKMKSELFKNKDWGSETVLENTLGDLANEKFALLEERNDIDHYEDIQNNPGFEPFLKHMQA